MWTSHLTTEGEKESFRLSLRNNGGVLHRLRHILDQKADVARSEATDKLSFDKPDWPNYQAYLMGQLSALKQVDQLLEFLDND